MRYVKTNTATRITVGPFMDATDGVTPEVSLSSTDEHITLVIDDGGVPTLILDAEATASGGDNDLVHITNDDAGFYDLELTAANLNYVGRGMLAITDADNHCPVFHELTILPAKIYDSLVAGSDNLEVDTVAVTGTAQTAGDLAALLANLPTTDELDTALAAADDDVLAAIAALNDLDAAGIRTAVGLASANLDTQLGNLPTTDELDTALAAADDDVLAAIAALNDLDAAGIRTAVGLASANLDTQLGNLPTTDELDTALAGLNDLATSDIAAELATYDAPTKAELDAGFAALNDLASTDIDAALATYDAPTKAELDAAVAGLATTDDIALVQSDIAALPTTDETAAIADAVWDEILTGATHNIATSAGRRLREITSTIIYSGTAASGDTNHIVLDAGASAVDGAYDPGLIAIVGGTGIGQSRLIMEYEGATRTAHVDRNWKVNPAADSEYVIYAHPGREHTNEGVAAGATASTLILNAYASTDDDVYNDQMVFVRAGTGEDQVRHITDYDGATLTASISPDWEVTPTTDSVYTILPYVAPCTPAEIREALGLASANLDTQLGNLPTTDELDTALAAADDAVLAAIAGLPTTDETSAVLTAISGITSYSTDEAQEILTAIAGLPTTDETAVIEAAIATLPTTDETSTIMTAIAALPTTDEFASLTASIGTTDIDAIVDGVWDEATAGLTTAGSIGKLLTDNIDAAISSVSSLGTGAVSWTVTITDGTNPLDGVDVWVTTDSAGANTVARGITDASGEVTFMLDAGTYYTWKQLAGYTFTNPETLTVA